MVSPAPSGGPSTLSERLSIISRILAKGEDEKARSISTATPVISSVRKVATRKATSPLGVWTKPFAKYGAEGMAAQIALYHHSILEKIQVTELRDEAWNKNPEAAPNVVEMIQRFNQLSFWLQTLIVNRPTSKARAQCIGNCIRLGRCLRLRKDYHGVMAVLSALNSAAIQRLKSSWADLSADKWRIFDNLNVLFEPSSNLARYRRILASKSPPAVPYLGTIVNDLTIFTEVSNFVECKDDPTLKLVNYTKMQALGTIFGTIRRFQSQQYRVEPDEDLQQFLRSDESGRTEGVILSENEIYDLTLKLEPRGEFQGEVRKNAKGVAGFLAKRKHMHSHYHA